MASQRHLRAFNRLVRAQGLDESGAVAPLVVLARDLARELDASGPTLRLVADYRAVLKELGRWAEVPAPVRVPNQLEAFRRAHGVSR